MALAFQGLAVLAVPLALCCCLAMAADADHASHQSAGHEPHAESMSEPCPHHDLDPRATDETGATTAGCQHLDRLIIALAGLIGVAPSPSAPTHALTPSNAVWALVARAEDPVFGVESPPPRA